MIMGARPLFHLRDVEIYLDVPSSSLALGPIVVNAEGHVPVSYTHLTLPTTPYV